MTRAGRRRSLDGQEEPRVLILTISEVPAGERRKSWFGSRRRVFAGRRHHRAGRSRLRLRSVAGHLAVGPDHWSGPRRRCRFLRSGENDLAAMIAEVLYGLLAPLLVVVVSWSVVKRAYRANPAGLMPV